MARPETGRKSPAFRLSSERRVGARRPVKAAPGWMRRGAALGVVFAAVLGAAVVQAQDRVAPAEFQVVPGPRQMVPAGRQTTRRHSAAEPLQQPVEAPPPPPRLIRGATAQPCQAACLAEALIAGIPSGEHVGLVPFGPPRTAIPREVADKLYDRIAHALAKSSGGNHRFTNKERSSQAWESWQAERETSDYEAFWNRRKVGVTVHCEDRGLEGPEVALSCTAFPVGEHSRLKGDVQGPLAVLPVKSPFFPYRYTVTRLGNDLARRALEPGDIADARIEDAGGQRSNLTRHIEETLWRVVEERFRERRRARRGQANLREAMGQGSETAVVHTAYELRGRMIRMDADSVELSAELRQSGQVLARADIRIMRHWLPSNLVRPDAGKRRYHATAHAVVSKSLGEDGARRAVMNLARARVVATALGLPPPDITEIRFEGDGVRALRRTLDHGIPTGERFQGPFKEGDGRWRVELDAGVVKVGSSVRPEFSARLARDELRAMEDIVIELSAREPVRAAVFAWGADNKVVRLYPSAKAAGLAVPAGGKLVLPQAGEGRIRAAPLPGNEVDHEAIIVVASGEHLPLEGLAPPVGSSVAATMDAAVSGGVFFGRLARLDLSRAAVSVLPYRVSRR